jgi:hypothetical protein
VEGLLEFLGVLASFVGFCRKSPTPYPRNRAPLPPSQGLRFFQGLVFFRALGFLRVLQGTRFSKGLQGCLKALFKGFLKGFLKGIFRVSAFRMSCANVDPTHSVSDERWLVIFSPDSNLLTTTYGVGV